MPQLKWYEYEVIECLGVLPEQEEFFESHHFKLAKGGLILELTIYEYESLITFSLFKQTSNKPFLTLTFIIRDEIKFINEKDSASLLFKNCILVSDQFWMYQGNEGKDLFDKTKFATELDIELTVYPHLGFKVI